MSESARGKTNEEMKIETYEKPSLSYRSLKFALAFTKLVFITYSWT